MQLLQDQHQPVVEDAALPGLEIAGPDARSQALQHIVEAGQRQMVVLGQHPLAMGAEFLGGIILDEMATTN